MGTTASVDVAARLHLLETVVRESYGVDAIRGEPLTVRWAALHIARHCGAEVAAAEWRRVNEARRAAGAPIVTPERKTPLWIPYYAPRGRS